MFENEHSIHSIQRGGFWGEGEKMTYKEAGRWSGEKLFPFRTQGSGGAWGPLEGNTQDMVTERVELGEERSHSFPKEKIILWIWGSTEYVEMCVLMK